MMQKNWFRFAFQLRGSVLPAIVPRILVCGAFSLFITLVYQQGWLIKLDVLSSVIPSVVLGLMLVFRTNTAYERYWEGRKLWGNLNNASRNLARHLWVSVLAKDSQERQEKIVVLYLLAAFAVATKQHLRQESIDEVESLLSNTRYARLKMMNHPPLEIAFWLQDYLQQQYQKHRLNIYQLSQMQQLINVLVDSVGGCERILRTPIPLAYAIHLKQLLLIYSLTLPFQFVEKLVWLTAPVVVLVSFTLFGIEQIGIEIENPFGHDANDLPLDTICQTIKRNIDDLILLEPSSSIAIDLMEDDFTTASTSA